MSTTIDPILHDLFEYRPRKGDLKKIEIIKASIECLATLGLENTTYEAIAKKIGTRRAHVAYHFKDKNEIFKSAIKYILACYQQISIDHLSKAKTPDEMLTNYIDAAFFWAEKNPDQAKVLLLFYYLCTLDEEYLQMHDSVKRKGQKRIYYILQELQGRKFNKENAIQLSSLIQNIISSNIKDSFTTHSLDLKFGKKQTKQIIKSLISNQGKV